MPRYFHRPRSIIPVEIYEASRGSSREEKRAAGNLWSRISGVRTKKHLLYKFEVKERDLSHSLGETVRQSNDNGHALYPELSILVFCISPLSMLFETHHGTSPGTVH